MQREKENDAKRTVKIKPRLFLNSEENDVIRHVKFMNAKNGIIPCLLEVQWRLA